MTLDEIRGLAVKSKIPRVEGTLQAVYETKRGTNAKGPWRIQNVILAQGDDSMRVTIFSGPNVDKSMEGEEVAIMCSEVKGGLSGVTADDNDYNGEVTRQIRIDRTGQIALLNDAPKNGGNPPVTVAAKATAKASAPVKPATLDEAIAIIGMLANVVFLAREAVEEMVATGTRQWTPEQVQASAGNIFYKFTDKFPVELKALPSAPMFLIPGKVDTKTGSANYSEHEPPSEPESSDT